MGIGRCGCADWLVDVRGAVTCLGGVSVVWRDVGRGLVGQRGLVARGVGWRLVTRGVGRWPIGRRSARRI